MTINEISSEQDCGCNSEPIKTRGQASPEPFPMYRDPEQDAVCCGPPAGAPSSSDERPGYQLCAFVETFIPTPAGAVPVVKTALDRGDRWGALRMRLGAGRDDYKVAPGLYAVGRPDAHAPVLVGANYKLSFDYLRKSLAGVDAWILVLDTRGINVWCAAGKGTFGTDEVIRQVRSVQLSQVVAHRQLVLPQLGAVGVAGRDVKKACGFEVIWGPIRAKDIPAFLKADMKADDVMRRVTFTLSERLVLIPVEVTLLRKYLLWVIMAVLVLSGIGGHIFSFSAAWHRGLDAVAALLIGVVAGCVVVPALLPWLPGRAFSVKGAITGLVLGLPTAVALGAGAGIRLTLWSGAALALWTVALSSFLSMNFTGSTPFTSPSGVEKEMRRAIPLQAAGAVIAVALWIGGGFGL